jgi:hypothetical protein
LPKANGFACGPANSIDFAYDLNHVPCMWFSIIFAAALKIVAQKNKE